jgi:hypothetical protein
VRLAEEGERLDLEVHIAEAASDRPRRHRQLLAFSRVAREGRLGEREPAVRGTLVGVGEHARRTFLPAESHAEVPLVGGIQERQPDRAVRSTRDLAGRLVQVERALPELDRTLVLALDHRDLAQLGERVGTIAFLERTLETRSRRGPVRGSDRALTPTQQIFPGLGPHRRRSSHPHPR